MLLVMAACLWLTEVPAKGWKGRGPAHSKPRLAQPDKRASVAITSIRLSDYLYRPPILTSFPQSHTSATHVPSSPERKMRGKHIGSRNPTLA